MNDAEEAQIIEIAMQLYQNLPIYKRWQISRYYKTNNWDVTGAWKECVHQATRMYEEARAQNKARYD